MAEPPPASPARRRADAPARDGARRAAGLRRALMLAATLAAVAWIAFHLR